MKNFLSKIRHWWSQPKLNQTCWLQNKADPTDIRRALYWDGKNRKELRKFLGSLQVKWWSGGSVIIAGYGQITMSRGSYIWDDSDGYDAGRKNYVEKYWHVTKDKPECP